MIWLALLLLLLSWSPARAATCTKGTDCYCDKVQGGSLNDTLVLTCEDFEAPTLHDNVGFGNGAPYYGPWYDDTGYTNNRGNNSYWAKKYNNGGNPNWQNGQPASPTFGPTCGFTYCTGIKVWVPGDLWNANGLDPCVTVLKNGEFNADIVTLSPPTSAAGGASGVFDGVQSFGYRIPAGVGNGRDCGILGDTFAQWGGTKRTFGVTEALAYATNGVSAGIWSDAWKHDEWHQTGQGAGGDGLFLFGISSGLATYTPFYGFIFYGTDTQATCNTKLAAATKTKGTIACGGTALTWTADSADYVQSTDWPFGSWGCARGYYQNMGLSNGAVQIKFTGPAYVEKTLIDFSGMDMTGMGNSAGYDGLYWNGYFNGNFDNGSNPGLSQTTFRYQDNLHIRAGAPVSCAQIGYTASAGSATTQIGGGWTIKPGWSF